MDVKGVGVDTASIGEIARYMESRGMDAPFVRQNFSLREQEAAAARGRPAEYLAARFAAKEAVFKAVAHLLPSKTFDLRLVETLNADDESPYVVRDGAFEPILVQAGVIEIHISLTTEGDYATAFVVVCG